MTRPELLAAVLADADVLWAAVTDTKPLAGPWERTGSVNWRPSKHRGNYAVIEHNRHPHPFCAYVRIGGERLECPYEMGQSVAMAERWCDARLREAGVLLASGPISDKD